MASIAAAAGCGGCALLHAQRMRSLAPRAGTRVAVLQDAKSLMQQPGACEHLHCCGAVVKQLASMQQEAARPCS